MGVLRDGDDEPLLSELYFNPPLPPPAPSTASQSRPLESLNSPLDVSGVEASNGLELLHTAALKGGAAQEDVIGGVRKLEDVAELSKAHGAEVSVRERLGGAACPAKGDTRCRFGQGPAPPFSYAN